MLIRDNETGEVFEYGTNIHHALCISKDGQYLSFENLQNGDGSVGGGYSFVLEDGKTPEESNSDDAMYGMTYWDVGGFSNPDMEKILQEIEDYETKMEDAGISCLCHAWVKEIIKKHLSENKCGNCSRRKFYMLGYQDGKKENDWIPIKNGFPKNDGVYDFTVITGTGEPVVVRWQFLSGKHLSGKQIYVDEKHYIANNYNGDPINKYLIKNITAWRPLPEPYKPDPESADGKRQREREEFFSEYKDGE